MTTTTTHNQAANRDINQIMNTNQNFQEAMMKNKGAVIGLVVFIVAAIIGYGIYSSQSEKKNAQYNSKIYEFEKTTFKKYQENVTNPAFAKELETGIVGLHAFVGNYVGLLPIVIKSTDLLMNNEQFAEAKTVILLGEKLASDDYAKYFVLSRKAAIFEDLKEEKLAIETLEKITSLSAKIFEGKTYLDMGRLHLKLGNKDLAKKNFTYVIEKAKNEAEFVKLAQLYLSKI
jgi:tetratricopeptide (TPR) repeat protein